MSDEFRPIGDAPVEKKRTGGYARYARAGNSVLALPLQEPTETFDVGRAEVSWNGKGHLRVEITPDGPFPVRVQSRWRIAVPLKRITAALGKEIEGDFPVTYMDGAIIVDITKNTHRWSFWHQGGQAWTPEVED